MGTVDLLVGARIERFGRTIRGELATLRRRKLIFSTGNTMPERNPALDPLLGELQRLRVRLDFQIYKLDAEQSPFPAQDRVVARARDILGDAVELTDLLFWFGADMPTDAGAESDAGTRSRANGDT